MQELIMWVISGILLLAVGYLGKEVSDRILGDNAILKNLRSIVRGLVEVAYSQFQSMDIPIEVSDVEIWAKNLYISLPDLVTLQVSGRVVVVPLKMLLPESIFVSICVQLYQEGAIAYEEFARQLEIAYQRWKAAGCEITVSKGVSLWVS